MEETTSREPTMAQTRMLLPKLDKMEQRMFWEQFNCYEENKRETKSNWRGSNNEPGYEGRGNGVEK